MVEENKMSVETIIAFHQLYLETVRRSLEITPEYIMSNNKKGKKEEFLVNRRQLQSYVGKVFEHTLKHLGEKINNSPSPRE